MSASTDSSKTYGILGHFYSPDRALAAAARLRDGGYRLFDLLTPFPVHGMDEAMGLKRSWVPWVTAVMATVGILTAQSMMIYIMVVDWPMNFGGKPFWPWPSFIPITFELMVLFSGVSTAVVAIWAGKRRNIPQPPVRRLATGATNDRFVVWIAAADPQFAPEQARTLLAELGAEGVHLIDREGNDVAH